MPRALRHADPAAGRAGHRLLRQRQGEGQGGPRTARRSRAGGCSTSRAGATDEDDLETMIRRLATYPKAIVLSGDVHFASSLALDFWQGTDPTVDSRVVQLHVVGRRATTPMRRSRRSIRAARFSQQLLRGLPFERLAWYRQVVDRRPERASRSHRPAVRRLRRSPGALAGRRLAGRDDDPGRQAAGLALAPDRAARRAPHGRRSCIRERLQPAVARVQRRRPARQPTTTSPASTPSSRSSPTELLRLLVFRTNVGVFHFEPDGAGHGGGTRAVVDGRARARPRVAPSRGTERRSR